MADDGWSWGPESLDDYEKKDNNYGRKGGFAGYDDDYQRGGTGYRDVLSYVDTSQKVDYGITYAKHAAQWKTMSEVNRQHNLNTLDAQLEVYTSHPLAARTFAIVAGSGDPKPDVVFISKSPGTAEVSKGNLERHEAFIGMTGKIVRDHALQWIPSAKCYYMYLFPFCTNNLTSDPIEAEESERGIKRDGRQWFNIPQDDYQVFLEYAKQRLAILRPKYVVCLGNEVTKAVVTKFKLKDAKSMERIQTINERYSKTDVISELTEKIKYVVVPCVTPYTYKQSNEKMTEDKGYGFVDNKSEENVRMWQQVFLRLFNALEVIKPSKSALSVLMETNRTVTKNSEEVQERQFIGDERIVVSGTVPVDGKRKTVERVPSKLERVPLPKKQKSLDMFSLKRVENSGEETQKQFDKLTEELLKQPPKMNIKTKAKRKSTKKGTAAESSVDLEIDEATLALLNGIV